MMRTPTGRVDASGTARAGGTVRDWLDNARALAGLVGSDRTTLTFGAIYFGIAALTILLAVLAREFADGMPSATTISNVVSLNRDGGLAEVLGYGAAFIAAANFLIVSIDRRSRCFFFLALLMAYIGLDDSLSYHEKMGEWLVPAFDLPALYGLRAQDFGEILAWSLAAGLLGLVLLWSLVRRVIGDGGVLLLVAIPFAMLVICGFLFDMLHIGLRGQIQHLMAYLEDGGELISAVAIAVLSVGIVRNVDVYYASIRRF